MHTTKVIAAHSPRASSLLWFQLAKLLSPGHRFRHLNLNEREVDFDR